MSFLIEYESTIRATIFFTLLTVLACAEFFIPLAKRKCSRIKQWFTNLSIVALSTFSVHFVFPLLAVGVAQFANENSFGLFNNIDMPNWATIVISLFMLDLLIYGQHRMMHRVPLFWLLHRMHHTELGLDVSSAVRFHPLEIIFSMLIKMTFVFLMGIPVVAVILFEVLLNGLALFNHSNIKLNKTVDKWLRYCIVTPSVHWIHHSQIVRETDSNYGFNLIIWDKLFSTYTDKPVIECSKMPQGLREYASQGSLSLFELLILPFKGKPNK